MEALDGLEAPGLALLALGFAPGHGFPIGIENQAGASVTVTIVGVDEFDPLKGKISWISPVARALIKARAGDSVLLKTPAGEDELTILSVDYPQ